MTWQFKLLLALTILGTAFAGGYKAAETKLQPVITELTAQLLAIDLKAKANEQKYTEVSHALKIKDNQYLAAIAKYKRLLSEASNSHGSGETPQNTPRMDETPSESTIIRCLDDARVRAGMAEHFRLNQYPIE